MKLNVYLEKLRGDSVFRTVLPVNQSILYPMFSVQNGNLCAHFLTHKTEIGTDGFKAFFPEFYMVFSYPGGKLMKFERLSLHRNFTVEDFASFDLVAKPSAEEAERKRNELSKLLDSAEKILTEWEETESADVETYNQAYFNFLTEKQKQALKKL